MYKALVEDTLVNLKHPNWKDKRTLLKTNKYKLRCQRYFSKVELHWAENPKRAPHFKHATRVEGCYLENESLEHEEGKMMLYEYFNSRYQHVTDEIDIECLIRETNQIADIFVKFKSGQKWAIEYQRSNISTEEVSKRKNLYKEAGIKSILTQTPKL